MSRPVAAMTGATGGIGEELAVMLACDGWDLVLLARDMARAAEVRDRVASEAPAANVAIVEGDLADRTSLTGATRQVVSDHPVLHALFNVAGLLIPEHRRSPAGVDLNLEINTLAPIALTHALADPLAAGATERGRAVVVNVSSTATKVSGPLDVARLADPKKPSIFGAYGQSKLALTVATKAMAPRFAKRGIELYAVDPGSNRTRMTASRAAPFFVRWMQRFIPGPENGAAKLMVPLNREWSGQAGALIVGGKTKAIPRGADAPDTVAALEALVQREIGVGFAPEGERHR